MWNCVLQSFFVVVVVDSTFYIQYSATLECEYMYQINYGKINFTVVSWETLPIYYIYWKLIIWKCELLTTGCNCVPGIMALASCICWASIAMFFCWMRLFLPLISSCVFRWGGGCRYLQFSLEQRPWRGGRTGQSERRQEEWRRPRDEKCVD